MCGLFHLRFLYVQTVVEMARQFLKIAGNALEKDVCVQKRALKSKFLLELAQVASLELPGKVILVPEGM